MYEKLLLFDDEIEKLKAIGWEYKILFEDKKKRIYLVKADIPQEVEKALHKNQN